MNRGIEMNDEQQTKMEQRIKDILGLPFYDSQSRELTRLNEHVEKSLSGIMDEFIEVVCGNCEFSCNESNCDKRHNT